MGKTLYRSRDDRTIAGVCGGIAEYAGLDPALVRLIAVALAVITHGGAILAYVIMALVVPETPLDGVAQSPEATTPQQAASSPAPAPVAPARSGSGRGGATFGLVLVAVGAVLLVVRFAPGLDLGRLWPLIIVAVGAAMIFGGRRG
ncbi:MAG: PspC domain-containing protein [Coriobacteriia bacterium]